MPPPTLGSVLSEARKKKGYSLREVADRVMKEDRQPISPQYLNDIEHSRRVPSAAVLQGLGGALDVDASYLSYLAGSWPSDLTSRAVNEEEFVEAYQLFRRKLDR